MTASNTVKHSVMKDGDQSALHHDLFHRHRGLVDWATALGGYMHSDARIAHGAEKGFHMIVASGRQIRAETRIVSCPMPAAISVLNAFDVEPFCSHGTKFPQKFLTNNRTRPEMIQTFFLMDQYVKGEDSWWAPYIRTLPSLQDVNDMQFELPDDSTWLEGTNLKSGFLQQTAKWQGLYAKGLRTLKVLGWASALNGKYSWELYRWAATIFGSRSFTSSVLDDTLPADQARMGGRHGVPRSPPWLKNLFIEKFSVLLPMLDILNHWPATPVEWQARSTFVGLQMLENCDSEQELCNNYGPKDNESLLLSYGFVIPNNPFDHVAIAIKPQPNPHLETARSWTQDERSHPDFKTFLLHPDHPTAKQAPCLEACPFSYDLLDTMSILFSNDRELQTMYTMERSLISHCLGHNKAFFDFRNLLMTLSMLLQECRAKGQKLRITYPNGKEPQSTKQIATQIYRRSQYLLFQFTCVVCEYTLLRASTDWSRDMLVTKLRDRFNNDAVQQFLKVSESYSCVTAAGELLSENEFLDMFPQDLAERLRSIMSTTVSQLSLIEDCQPHIVAAQSCFALLLSAAYNAYMQGEKLPSRLRQWIEDLTQWYPPSNPNWAYVPAKGPPWPPGEAPPRALMAFLDVAAILSGEGASQLSPILKANMLCWGWNVMDEEAVMVPEDLMKLMSDGSSLRLYCKRY